MADYGTHGHVQAQRVNPIYGEHQAGGYSDDHEDLDSALPQRGRLGRMLSVLGALGSIALVAGIGVWSYKLVMRDVSGVPVVRALEGPLRIQPTSPGGTPADHQGLAVNNVAAVGTAAPPADRLQLAPQPVALDQSDAPMGELTPKEEVAEAPKPHNGEPSAEAIAAFRQGSVDALVAELTQNVEPMVQNAVLTTQDVPDQLTAIVQPEPLPAIDPADLVAKAPELELLNAPGVKVSLRPQTRPARATPASASADADVSLEAAISAAVETAAGLDVDPDAIPKGTRLAQLGAYDSPEVARAEWDRLSGLFSGYLDGKQRVVQKASSGGRTFYRLRAMGFEDMSDARRFCSALVAENADCIPVTVR